MNFESWVEQFGESTVLGIGGACIGLMFGFFAQRSKFCLRAAAIEFWHRKIGEKLFVSVVGVSWDVVRRRYHRSFV